MRWVYGSDNVNKAVLILGQLKQHKLRGGLTKPEMKALTEMVTILEPFEEATAFTQSEKVVIVSLIVPADFFRPIGDFKGRTPTNFF